MSEMGLADVRFLTELSHLLLAGPGEFLHS